LARGVWSSKFAGGTDVGKLIFDGGFENITASDKSGFGWHIDQNVSDISVSRVDDGVHSGSHALKVKFAGRVETEKTILSQLVYLKPGKRYQLRFWFRSTKLVSAGLPALVISDHNSNKLLGRPVIIQSTDDRWTESTIDFTTNTVPIINVSLRRINCEASPCPIFGEVYLDDFSILER
jgi:hypothetical protein